MYAQLDAEGNIKNMMEAILDYKKDSSAIDIDEMYIKTKSGQHRIQKPQGNESYWFNGRTETSNGYL